MENFSHFLNKTKDEIARKVSRQITDATGMDCEVHAETLQVSHYGIGGHYDPHYDNSLVTTSVIDTSFK